MIANAAAELTDLEISFIPASAMAGDNVVTRSNNMPWYEGPCLLNLLEQKIDGDPVSPDSTVPTAPTPVSAPKASSCLLRSSFQKCDPETIGLVSHKLLCLPSNGEMSSSRKERLSRYRALFSGFNPTGVFRDRLVHITVNISWVDFVVYANA
jgi:hypothetical protein